MEYWVVMFDRDGGESEVEGPFADRAEEKQYAISEMEDWRWVHYGIQEGDV